jgi:hypothetical protein
MTLPSLSFASPFAFVFAFALAFLVVIPEGDLLPPLSLLLIFVCHSAAQRSNLLLSSVLPIPHQTSQFCEIPAKPIS